MSKASKAKPTRIATEDDEDDEENGNLGASDVSDNAHLNATQEDLKIPPKPQRNKTIKRCYRFSMLAGSWLLMFYLGAKGQSMLHSRATASPGSSSSSAVGEALQTPSSTSSSTTSASSTSASSTSSSTASVAGSGNSSSSDSSASSSFRGGQELASHTTSGTTFSTDAPASYGFLYTSEGMALLDELVSLSHADGGAKPALKTAKKYLTTNRHFGDACHPLLHRFGRTLYRQGEGGITSAFAGLIDFDADSENEAKTILSGVSPASAGAATTSTTLPDDSIDLLMVCNAAYLHGIIELFLFKAGLVGQIEAAQHFVERRVCRRLGTTFRPAWECRHGVGHGLVQYQRHSRLVEALNQALDLGANMASKADVWNGIWMDHFASTEYSGHDADDPAMALSICYEAVFKKRGLGDCTLYSPTAFLLHRPRAYVEALTWCQQGCFGILTDPAASSCERSCVTGVGMQTLKENMDNVTVLGRVCDQVRASGHIQACLNGAKGYYSFAMGGKFPVARCSEIDVPRVAKACKR